MKDYSRFVHYFSVENWTSFPIQKEWNAVWFNGGPSRTGMLKEEIQNWLSSHNGDVYSIRYDEDQNQSFITFSREEDATLFILKFG